LSWPAAFRVTAFHRTWYFLDPEGAARLQRRRTFSLLFPTFLSQIKTPLLSVRFLDSQSNLTRIVNKRKDFLVSVAVSVTVKSSLNQNNLPAGMINSNTGQTFDNYMDLKF